MSLRRVALLLGTLAVVAAVGWTARPAPETDALRVERLASELRCPVCQGLSVADSPSDTARQMRDLVAQRVAQGRSDDQIRDEFRAAYGEWVVLSPPLADPRGLVWLLPLILVGGGALAIVLAIRRRSALVEPPPSADQLALLRARAAQEETLE